MKALGLDAGSEKPLKRLKNKGNAANPGMNSGANDIGNHVKNLRDRTLRAVPNPAKMLDDT